MAVVDPRDRAVAFKSFMTSLRKPARPRVSARSLTSEARWMSVCATRNPRARPDPGAIARNLAAVFGAPHAHELAQVRDVFRDIGAAGVMHPRAAYGSEPLGVLLAPAEVRS